MFEYLQKSAGRSLREGLNDNVKVFRGANGNVREINQNTSYRNNVASYSLEGAMGHYSPNEGRPHAADWNPFHDKPNAVAVGLSQGYGVRGMGEGRRAYMNLARNAYHEGADFMINDSSRTTSPEARHVWDSMAKRGYPVQTNHGKVHASGNISAPRYSLDLKSMFGHLPRKPTEQPAPVKADNFKPQAEDPNKVYEATYEPRVGNLKPNTSKIIPRTEFSSLVSKSHTMGVSRAPQLSPKDYFRKLLRR